MDKKIKMDWILFNYKIKEFDKKIVSQENIWNCMISNATLLGGFLFSYIFYFVLSLNFGEGKSEEPGVAWTPRLGRCDQKSDFLKTQQSQLPRVVSERQHSTDFKTGLGSDLQ